MFKKNTLLSLLAVSALALTACGTNDGTTEPDVNEPAVEGQEESAADETTTEESTDDTEVEVASPTADDYANLTLQPEEAFDIYQDQYPNAKITQIQLDKDMGNFVYKVEGFEDKREIELKIDPIDGTILKEDTDQDDDMDDLPITRDQVTKIKALVDEALTDAGADTQLEEWTLDMDDGIPTLEIELDKKGMDDEERTYNVETGVLLEIDN